MHSLGRRRFVTKSALSEILKELQSIDSAGKGTSRQALRRAREPELDASNKFGDVFREIDFEDTKVTCLHPLALLQHLLIEAPAFSEYFSGLLTGLNISSPDSALRLVFYADEVTPGNQLKHDNKRKLQAIYWTIQEMGSTAMSMEHMWFILTTVRSNIVTDCMPGGMSAFITKLLCLFFDDTVDSSTGVTFQFSDQSFKTVFFRVGALVADEGALKQCMDMKGASGWKPCVLCQNVVSIHSKLSVHDSSHSLVDIATTDIRKFALYKDSDIHDIISKLDEAERSTARGAIGTFRFMQKSTGFNLNRQGVLYSLHLRNHFSPVKVIMYDWMHVYLVSGIFNHEAGLLLIELHKHAGLSHDVLHDFCQHFNWPARLKSVSGKNVFQKRSAGASDLKCSASEALTVFSVVRLFLVDEVLPVANDRVRMVTNCFLLLCCVLDLLTRVGRGTVGHIELHGAIVQHLDAHKAAYGPDSFFPKMHLAMHLGMQLELHGTLIACFVHERKHKEVKRFGNHLPNTSALYEKNILQETLCAQIITLRDASRLPNASVHLHEPKVAPPQIQHILEVSFAPEILDACQVSKTVYYAPSQQASTGDCVQFLLDDILCVGQVQFNAAARSRDCVTCITPWTNLGKNRFETSNSVPVIVPSSSIKETHMFSISGSTARVVP